MALIDWSKTLAVGNTMIDSDHQRLIALMNELFDAVRANRSKEVLGGVLAGLIDYTKTHFGHEEVEMLATRYPLMNEHKLEHVRLTQQVVEVQRKFQAGATAVLTMEVMTFLRDWLTNHIQQRDTALGVWLNQHGHKAA